jgi:general secretion pathway protein M
MKIPRLSPAIGRTASLAMLGYALAVLVLAGLTWAGLSSLMDRYAAYSAMAERLARLEDHARGGATNAEADLLPQGSAFLEGASLPIAGASLQHLATAAVEANSGAVLSSQIDLRPDESDSDRVSLTLSFEIEQAALQKMLYDLEAGLPFLFIDRLAIQSVDSAKEDSTRMRITLTVAGQWQHLQ